MKLCVAIATSSFASVEKTPEELLVSSGVDIKPNPYGRKMDEREIKEHLRGVDGLIAGLEPLNRGVLESSTSLKAIARVGIGMDNVDIKAAEELGILVSNTPDGPTDAVAELCLASLLAIGRNLLDFNDDLHRKTWKKRIGFGLRGLSVLLVGYGRIGRKFGELLRHLGSEIMVFDPYAPPPERDGITVSRSLAEGLASCDVVSIHASGTNTILGKEQFQALKPGAVVLNSARGALIDEDALVQALEKGIVSNAWLDVFENEPYLGKLTEYPQVLLTPHVSTYTRQCRRQMEEDAVNNLLRDLGVSQR